MTDAGQRKGLGAAAWVGIGCGSVVLLIAIVVVIGGMFVSRKAKSFVGDVRNNPALAMANVIAAGDPDVEVVDSDSDAQTVTLRNKKTGETIEVNAGELKQGKLSFKSHDSTVSLDAAEGEQGGLRSAQTRGWRGSAAISAWRTSRSGSPCTREPAT